MICGIGVDLVEVKRIEDALHRWGERFQKKVFTPREVDYCSRKKRSAPNFAARFAAKEAFAKALGLGMRRGIHWKDVEVERGLLGQPVLKLSGRALELCQRERIESLFLSLTHDRNYSIAMVVLEKSER